MKPVIKMSRPDSLSGNKGENRFTAKRSKKTVISFRYFFSERELCYLF